MVFNWRRTGRRTNWAEAQRRDSETAAIWKRDGSMLTATDMARQLGLDLDSFMQMSRGDRILCVDLSNMGLRFPAIQLTTTGDALLPGVDRILEMFSRARHSRWSAFEFLRAKLHEEGTPAQLLEQGKLETAEQLAQDWLTGNIAL